MELNGETSVLDMFTTLFALKVNIYTKHSEHERKMKQLWNTSFDVVRKSLFNYARHVDVDVVAKILEK